MKKYLALFVLLTFIWSNSGCHFQPRPIQYDPFPYPSPRMPNSAPILIIAAAAVAITAVAMVIRLGTLQKNRRLFQEIGSRVSYLMHEEAPAGARFLGEVECREGSQTEVKNLLRIKAAQMGGNLLVIDAISESSDEHNLSTFSGSGRVYLVNESPQESH